MRVYSSQSVTGACTFPDVDRGGEERQLARRRADHYTKRMPENPLTLGPFSFDRSGAVLLRDGRPLELGQRAVALLRALLEARGEVVTKAELLERVWPDVV